jgi:protein SCO1
MQRRRFVTAAAAATLAPCLPGSPVLAAQFQQDGAEWFTNVEVTAQDGRSFRFYDDLMKDKIILVNFFFTECPGVCPLMTQNLANLPDLLGDRFGRDIFMYSISLQPEHDTPERLADYASLYGVGPGWLLLTGKATDIELLRHRLGFVDSDPAQDADLEQHLGTVRIANVPMHRWIMSPALLNPAAIVRAVKRVMPEPV